MMAPKLNNKTPAPKQIWTHVNTDQSVLVLAIDDANQMAYCAMLGDDHAKVTKRRVAIPATKLMNWGNRGFAYRGDRRGSLPKIGEPADYPEYIPRRTDLGAK